MSGGPPKLSAIDDPIAEDTWSVEVAPGVVQKCRVTVGRPQPIPGEGTGDWYCPLFIEHRMQGIRTILGVGPVDALMNAMQVVQELFRGAGTEPNA